MDSNTLDLLIEALIKIAALGATSLSQKANGTSPVPLLVHSIERMGLYSTITPLRLMERGNLRLNEKGLTLAWKKENGTVRVAVHVGHVKRYSIIARNNAAAAKKIRSIFREAHFACTIVR